MTFVMYVVPPMILKLIPTFLLNYPMHIAVHTHRHCASLSIPPICYEIYEAIKFRVKGPIQNQPVYFSVLVGDLEGASFISSLILTLLTNRP